MIEYKLQKEDGHYILDETKQGRILKSNTFKTLEELGKYLAQITLTNGAKPLIKLENIKEMLYG